MTSKAKRLRQVYLRAAEVLLSSKTDVCCWAIWIALDPKNEHGVLDDSHPAIKAMEKLFSFSVPSTAYWMDDSDECAAHVSSQDLLNRRILALLFMAEIAKDF